MYYANQSFNSSMIFSTIEIMVFMKQSLFLSSMGISYIYELKVLLKRFVDIYSMDNICMRRIDEATKQPFLAEAKNSSVTNQDGMSVSLQLINLDGKNNEKTESPQ